MQTRKEMVLLALVLAIMIGLAGCSDDSANVTSTMGLGPVAVDENVAISDLEIQIEKHGVDVMRAVALDWKAAIDTKTAEFTELTQQVAAKSAEALLNENVKMEVETIKANMDELKNSIAALTERFDVIFAKLEGMGGDVSGLDIKKII